VSLGVPQPATRRSPSRKRGFFTRGRVVVLALFLIASAAIGYQVYQSLAGPAVAPPTTVAIARGNITASIAAAGAVVPANLARLSFGVGGKLAALHVSVGTEVEAGQVLAEIDTAQLEIKLEQTRSSLRTAEIRLRQLRAGSREADVVAAQAAYDSALARYNELAAGSSVVDIMSAEQAVLNAQSGLQKAELDLARLVAGLSEEERLVARADLEKKEAALSKAQGDYDRVAWREDIGSRPEAINLQQARIDYEAALANYRIKTAAAMPADIAMAEKGIESARAALASAEARLTLLRAGPKPADVEAARSNLASARAGLLGRTEGPTTEELELQEEQIIQAQIAVRQAELDLASAKLVAPFSGIVASATGSAGEQVSSGTSVITIIDPRAVRVEANVDEIDVAKLAVGQAALVTFESLPNERFEGRVAAIAPTAVVQQGVVSYLVAVAIDNGARTLPAGMTAAVTFVVDQKDDVLLVPNRAIRAQAGGRTVHVMTANGPEARTVRIGLSGEQMSEVLEGLQEGEAVMVNPSSTTAPSIRVGGMPITPAAR
jgi:HlyD family secretion protein